MSYPQIIDYNEAVQDPRNAFVDPELKAGKVAETPLGLPLALSGGFALTYTVNSGGRKFAVRCFHRAIPEAQSRYAAISSKLRSLVSPYFVNFDFQSQGIRVRGASFPIVKMDWVEGDTLGIYLDRVASNRSAIAGLRKAFVDLATFLERNGVAHGDLQNENVIVANGALKLIDYDGMFVEGMQEGRGTEVGHKHFQHPGRETSHFGPRIDRFSFIVLDVSLEALQADASLHRRFREGGQAILFKANDYADPTSSEIFKVLNGMPALHESARKLAAVCGGSISNIPTLSDFIAGRSIPIVIARPAGVPKAAPANYIGAYEVVDAEDFVAVMRRVGDKIELVGQIVSVKQGIGKRGRGRDRPYVFINFGIWNKNSVKVTIWSEGLGNMTTRPSEAWVGRWISATGLIEPPYEGKHYGRPYRSVGITATSDNQIIQLTEQEAKFRLRRTGSVAGVSPTKGKRLNEDILSEIAGRPTGSGGRQSAPIPPPTPRSPYSGRPVAMPSRTPNENILAGLRPSQPPPSPVPMPPLPPAQFGLLSRIPGWVWVVALFGLALLFLAGQ